MGCAGWVAVTLAELGGLRPRVVGAVALLFGVALTWSLRRRARAAQTTAPPPPAGGAPRHSPLDWRRVVALASILTIAALVLLPPFSSIVWADDATVYLAFGRQIAESGTLQFDDSLLESLPSATRRDLFRNPVPLDATGPYARFPGGFAIPDPDRPLVTAGFAPLYPVLLALGWATAGRDGALLVAPLCALLAVAAAFLVARRLGGLFAGCLAALALALSLPQLWFARLGTAEVIAELFVLSGLLALLASREAPALAAAAGLLFGCATLAKFDLIAVLTVALIGYVVIALASGSPSLRRRVALFAGTFSLLLLHNLVHYRVTPSHYLPFLRWKIDNLSPTAIIDLLSTPVTATVTLTLVVGTAVVAGWLLRRHATGTPADRRTAWAAVALLVALAAYAAAYFAVSSNRLAGTLPALGWYLSWPVVAGFLLAAVVLLRARRPAEARAEAAFVVVLVAAAAFHYLYDPQEPVRYIWSVRRLVPTVIPGILIVVAVGVASLVAELPDRRRRLVALPLAVALVALVGQPSLVVIGAHAGALPWSGAAGQVDRVAAALPRDAVVLVDESLAGVHLALSLGYLYDFDALLIAPGRLDAERLEDTVLAWLAANRRVVLLLGDSPFHVAAPRLALAPIADAALRFRVLETTTSRRPEEMVEQRLTMHLLDVNRSAPKHSVDVGAVASDALVVMRGFHGPEHDAPGGSYRWTLPVASIELPRGADEIRLLVAADRPQGAPAARISIRIDGRPVVESLPVADAPEEVVVPAPQRAAGEIFTLTIQASDFQPSRSGGSDDDRRLGVKVYRVDY